MATHTPGETPPDLPLSGMTVLDMSRHLPGPWCAQLLGDMGATVVKLEHKGAGDHSRHNPPIYARDSIYFHSVNAGKRSIALDLRKMETREITRRLFQHADVVLESFTPGNAHRLGVDYDRARAINPRIVYAAISGFGQTGPYATAQGHDLAIQAMTGVLGVAGRATMAPQNPAALSADYAGAAMAAIGVLGALLLRSRTERGTYLDVSMLDSMVGMGNVALAPALARLAGAADTRILEVYGSNPRYRSYPTADGKAVAVCLLEAHFWRDFCNEIGRPDLIDTAESSEHRLSDHAERAAVYERAIAGFCAAHPRDVIATRMRARGVPVMPIYDPHEALTSDLAHARGLVQLIEHTREGTVCRFAPPFPGSGLTRRRDAIGPALGEHTDSILAGLNFAESDIAILRAAGAI